MATFALKPDTTTGASYFHGLSGPSPFFAGSDMQALGVLRAARELGLSVPRDLSVVGYDDLPVIEWTDPPLTTVRQPLRKWLRWPPKWCCRWLKEQHRLTRA